MESLHVCHHAASSMLEILGSTVQSTPRIQIRVKETHYARSDKHNPETNLKFNEELEWGCYGRGALYALQNGGYRLTKGIVGYICGSDGLDSSGLSSSVALDAVKRKVAKMSGKNDDTINNVRVVVSPCRICPLGAHIDHQLITPIMCSPSATISRIKVGRTVLPSSNLES